MRILKKRENRGFTVVELLVVIGIMMLILSIMIPSFATWRAGQDLTFAQRELVSNLQRARGYALTGKRILDFNSKYYGIRFALNSGDYTLEGVAYDFAGGPDRKYDGATYPPLETLRLPGGVVVSGIAYERPIGQAQVQPSCLIVSFALPYAQAYIDTDIADGLDDDGSCAFFNKYTDASSLSAWGNAQVTLTLSRPGTSAVKTVTINAITGQIGTN